MYDFVSETIRLWQHLTEFTIYMRKLSEAADNEFVEAFSASRTVFVIVYSSRMGERVETILEKAK